MHGDTRRWAVAKTWAVPVRAIYSAEGDLDSLEEAILGLCALKPRACEALAGMLGFSEPVVQSALISLCDKGLLKEAGGVHSHVMESLPQSASRSRKGWIVLDPGTGRPIPRLWISRTPPGLIPPTDPGIWRLEGEDFRRWRNANDLEETRLQEMLGAFCVAGSQLRAYAQAGVTTRQTMKRAEEDDDEADFLPQDPEGEDESRDWALVSLRSLRLRTDGRDEDRRTWKAVHCKFALDFIPRFIGPATCVAHEPDVAEGPLDRPDTPISPSSLDFLRSQIAGELEAHAALLQSGQAFILQAAGFAIEDLGRLVAQHFAQCSTEFGHPGTPLTHGEEAVESGIRNAEEWLMLSRREAKYIRQARDAYGHAIESLCRELATHARPALRAWVEQWRKGGKGKTGEPGNDPSNQQDQVRRLSGMGLDGRLGDSLSHLKAACRDVSRLPSEIEKDSLGAGASLALWLLPLMLLVQEEAMEYAGPIRNALEKAPELFVDLDDLVNVRNDVFHEKGGKHLGIHLRLPDAVDQRLMKAWCAILMGRRAIGVRKPIG